MINKTIILKQLKKELPYLSKEFHVTKLGLFGSFVRNEQTNKSDVDLLVTFKKGHNSLINNFRLSSYLEKQLKYKNVNCTYEITLKNDEIANSIRKQIEYVN